MILMKKVISAGVRYESILSYAKSMVLNNLCFYTEDILRRLQKFVLDTPELYSHYSCDNNNILFKLELAKMPGALFFHDLDTYSGDKSVRALVNAFALFLNKKKAPGLSVELSKLFEFHTLFYLHSKEVLLFLNELHFIEDPEKKDSATFNSFQLWSAAFYPGYPFEFTDQDADGSVLPQWNGLRKDGKATTSSSELVAFMNAHKLDLNGEYISTSDRFNLIPLNSNRLSVSIRVSQNGYLLQRASEALRHDKKVVLAAVKHAGYALDYASDVLKGDKDVAFAAVSSAWGALKCVSADLRYNEDFVLVAIKQSGWALQFFSADLRNNESVVLSAVKKDGLALQYASEALRNNKRVVLAAVRQDNIAFSYASEALRRDWEVLAAAFPIKINRRPSLESTVL